MSNEENAKNTINATKDKISNIVATLLEMKSTKPKVFYGIVGGVVVLLLLAMMSGGDKAQKPPLAKNTVKNISVGQKYVLKSANAYDEGATVRLVSVPGEIKAYDDTEEADRNGACQHMPQGTPVSVQELQDAFGGKNTYVKVQIEDGQCKGTSGWALAIDLQ